MVDRVGSDDQFSRHEGVQISAGFGAAEDEFTRAVGHKSDRGNPLPVYFQVAFTVMPELALESDAFAGNQIYLVAVQLKSVGDI